MQYTAQFGMSTLIITTCTVAYKFRKYDSCTRKSILSYIQKLNIPPMEFFFKYFTKF